MCDLERRLHKGDHSEKLDRQIIVGKPALEIMHPQADLSRRVGGEVTPQGYLLAA